MGNAKQVKFKKTLDDQMGEIRANCDDGKRRREQERLNMLAQIEENKRITQAEHDEERRKKDEQGKINTHMLGKIEQYKQEEKDRKQRAQDDMTRWLRAEKDRKEEEERQNRIIYARKCEQAQKELEENRQERAERK